MRNNGVVLTGVIGAYLFSGCVSATTPLPPGSTVFTRPASYQLWWSMTEACSGLSADLSRITWYFTPGTSQLPGRSDDAQGLWIQNGDRIVLADSARLIGPLVRHEMLHALIGPGQHGHSRELFVGRCGGIVSCEDACLRDAGPPPPPGKHVLVMSAESLQVTARAIPELPSASQYGGYFALVIQARNNRPDSVVIPLPDGDATVGGRSFGYVVTGSSQYVAFNVISSDVGVRIFGPGETKLEAFDLLAGALGTRHDLTVGDFNVFGSFGLYQPSAPLQLTISP